MSVTNGKWEARVVVPTGGWSATLEEYLAADVVWASIVNCVASGNDLTKNAGGPGWNAGAVSVASLAGNGFAEWSFAQIDYAACGLSVGNPGVSETEIDYAIIPFVDGTIHIFENGSERGSGYGTYTIATIFRVQRVGNQITYWCRPSGGSWTLLYTSLIASAGTLLVDCSIYSEGAAITNAVLYTGDGGNTVSLTAAKTYYHSSPGNDTLDLPAKLAALLDAAGTDTYSVSIAAGESGTGRYTIAAPAIPFTLVWTGTALRDLLGFVCNLGWEDLDSDGDYEPSVPRTSYLASAAAEGLWLPDCPPLSLTAFGDELDETDETATESPDASNVHRLIYNRRSVLLDLRYPSVSRGRARIAGETYGNQSWQRFWRDVVNGEAAAYLAIGRVRIYPDAAIDTTYYNYWVGALKDCTPIAVVEGWLGLFGITIPRLLVDES